MGNLKRIKDKIAKDEPVIGVHARSCDSELIELLSAAGNDFIWIEGEHSSLDKQNFKMHIIAAQARGSAAFVRVPWNDPVLVKPILELGPDGIIFPMVCTAEEAKRAVASCMYPPKGIRGFGPQRAMNFGMMPTPEYLDQVDDSIWKIIQIEHVEAVNNLDSILEVPHVDAIVVGMMDLSGSVNKLGQLDSPEVMSLMDTIAVKAARHNVPMGVSMAFNPSKIRYWIDKGIRWISVGADVEYVCQGALNTLKNVSEMFKQKEQ